MPIANMESILDKKAALETLLFQYGAPLTMERIARILHIKPAACEKLVAKYEAELNASQERGMTLVHSGNSVQLVTKPEYAAISEQITKEEFRQELTPAALEVLTMVAYLGPITRMNVDYVRGVNSSFSLRNLMMRGLIERERKEHTYKYSITLEFLKHMGLHTVEELPEYEQHHGLMSQFDFEEMNVQNLTPNT